MGKMSRTIWNQVLKKYKNDPKVKKLCEESNSTMEEAVADFIEEIEWSTSKTIEEICNMNIFKTFLYLSNGREISSFRAGSKVTLDYKKYVNQTLSQYLDENGNIDEQKIEQKRLEQQDYIQNENRRVPYDAVNFKRGRQGLAKIPEEELQNIKMIEIPELAPLYGNCHKLFVYEEMKLIIPCYLFTTYEHVTADGFLSSLEGPSFDLTYSISNQKVVDMVQKEINVILEEHDLNLTDTHKFFNYIIMENDEVYVKITTLFDAINYNSISLQLEFFRNLPNEYKYLREYSCAPIEHCVNFINGDYCTTLRSGGIIDSRKELKKLGYKEIYKEIEIMNQTEA